MPEFVNTDEKRLKQVLHNILQNSIKFTLRGKITVIIDYDPNICKLMIKVKDTGIGISDADKPNVFQLFGNINQLAYTNTKGIGLGLHICKRIVENFNG